MNESNNVYIGTHCAVTANGGFSTTMTLTDISFIGGTIADVITFDLTDTVQINYDVRLFNEKIGLVKDANNNNIISTLFDPINNSFPTDNFYIHFQEFRDSIDISNVVSVGAFQHSFIDFEIYLNNYFFFADGFHNLLKQDSYNDLSNNTFDSGSLIHLLNDTRTDSSGNIIDTFGGSIQLTGLNNLLDTLTVANPFYNRAQQDKQNGFIAGDLILVNPGMNLTLELIIKNEDHLPDTSNNSIFTLTQQYHAPLLLRLQTLS